MKRRLALSAMALLVAAGLAIPAQSQQWNPQSAGISGLWGEGLMHHSGDAGWVAARPGLPLMPGDSVMAAQGSRMSLSLGEASVTLHPGAQIDWAGQQGQTPVLRLNQGRAEIDMPGRGWNHGLALLTPWGMARLEEPGNYGVSQDQDGRMRLVVWGGYASIPSMGVNVGPGQMALLTENGAALAMAPAGNEVPAIYAAPAAVYAPMPPPPPPAEQELGGLPALLGILMQGGDDRRHDEDYPHFRHAQQNQQEPPRHQAENRPHQSQPHQAPQQPPQPAPQPAPQPRPQLTPHPMPHPTAGPEPGQQPGPMPRLQTVQPPQSQPPQSQPSQSQPQPRPQPAPRGPESQPPGRQDHGPHDRDRH